MTGSTYKLVAVVEPPFLEPSMPRPEVHRIAALIAAQGGQARVVDANLSIYRGMLADVREEALSHDPQLLETVFAGAFSVEVAPLRDALDRSGALPGDLPEAARGALLTGDQRALCEAINAAFRRLTGSDTWMGHGQYVRDIQLLDAALDMQMRSRDPSSRLTLHAYASTVNIVAPDQVLESALNPAGPLTRLYDEFLRGAFSGVDAALVVISEESQLLPGLTLAAWLRGRLGLSVALTGEHLDVVLSLHFPSFLGVADAVIAYRFEYGGPAWLRGLSHPFVHLVDRWNPGCRFPAWIPDASCACPGEVPVFRPHGYLSPLPLVGGTLAARCYWSQCGFCGIAERGRYPVRSISVQGATAAFRGLAALGVEHVQLLDYAVPPAFFKGFAQQGPSGVRWAAQARFERAFLEPGLFSRLANAGCVALCWGFETASERLLRGCRKGGLISSDDRGRVLNAAAEAGILNGLFIVSGLPGETDEDFIRTAEWLAAHADSFAFIEPYAFQLRPGTAYVKDFRDHLPEEGEPHWCLDVPHSGVLGIPARQEAETQARWLASAFASLPVRSKAHDWLEGHLALHRTLTHTPSPTSSDLAPISWTPTLRREGGPI